MSATVDAFSTSDYEYRMQFIRFIMVVNGETKFWSDGTLLPGGNFAISLNSLAKTGNKYELRMLPNQKQHDRFDGYSVAYRWDPSSVVVDSSEWLLPGFATGAIRIPVGTGKDLRVMKFKNFEQVGLLNVSWTPASSTRRTPLCFTAFSNANTFGMFPTTACFTCSCTTADFWTWSIA